MSQSPTPSAPGAPGTRDWRLDVPQAARNQKVREIATVLASLEPGASSTSKLRLAMQFEDTVFKGSDSLIDYQKKLVKRLNKLQRNYVPAQTNTTEKERTIEALRQNHGESIRYVLKHASIAVAEMTAKNGKEKGVQLEQHLDLVKIWAQDLGLLDSNNNAKPNYDMADDQLERLKQNIERRLENVRAHVVKFADPDRFFVETLEKAEEDCHGPIATLLTAEVKKRYLQLLKSNLEPEELMKEALVVERKPIPQSTRSQRNDEKAALIHLDKMRAASSAYLAFMALEDKSMVPKGLLKKLHVSVTDGMQFVAEVMKEHRKQTKEPDVSLQDAWMRQLDYKPDSSSNNSGGGGGGDEQQSLSSSSLGQEPPAKRPRLIALRSRRLLTAGRKTPPNLLVEFHRKGAKLVRPPPRGEGSHLILEFGKAFFMTIYLVPLLVELRAYQAPVEEEEDNNNNGGGGGDEKPCSSHAQQHCAAAVWTPLHHGLAPNPHSLKNKKHVDAEKKDAAASSSTTATTTTTTELTVWNVKGDYETCGHVVEERLRDASAHATFVLRNCFAHNLSGKTEVNDFEMEILEGQALRDFLQLARNTYTPDWKDLPVPLP